MLQQVPVCAHATATTPAEPLRLRSLAGSQRWQPSPLREQVGFRIGVFEACSAFTRVAACTLAESPKATLYIGGFGCFVTSTTAPIATGSERQLPGGDSHPAEDRCLSTAH